MLFLALLLAVFLSTTQADAQGIDFPGGWFAPAPSWSSVPTFSPQPGWDWHNGTAAGPYYLQNHAHAKVQVQFVFDWWSLGPVQFVIRTSGDNNMHWLDGGSWWQGTCILHCTAEFEATTDNVVVWLEFTGTNQFGAHLEFTITEPANEPGDTIKRFIKDRAHARGDEADNTADFLTVTTLPLACATNLGLCIFTGGTIVWLQRAARQLHTVDPFDWQYNVP